MTTPVRVPFIAEIKALAPETRQVKFRITTGAPDRMRDTINPAGWDLRHYRQNPVVLFGHDYTQPPIARAVDITADAQGLLSTAEFATKDVYPFADQIYQLVKAGFIRGVSVGFRPIKHVFNERRGGIDYLEQELLEYSVVAIPANPEALIAAGWRGSGGGRSLAARRDDETILHLDDEEVGVVSRGVVSREEVIAAVRAVVPILAAEAGARARGEHEAFDLDAIGNEFDPQQCAVDAAALAEVIKMTVPAMLRAELNRLRGRID